MFDAMRRVPRTVWALGLVSLFMDTSSEMIHGLLPVFLVGSLGASAAMLGLIEGVAEATASFGKVFSGWLSDRLGHRKWLVVLGYGLAALTKPVFPFAVTPMQVLAARFADRIGKGVRGAPRDALIADVTPPELRGAAFGLRQSLDTVGAFAGPLIAIGLMAVLHNDIRGVFAFAVVPALIAVSIAAVGVREKAPVASTAARPPIRWSDVRTIGRPFWVAALVGVLFTLARFSEAFLVVRGVAAGLPLMLAPMVLIVMNLVYAAVSTPVGVLSDAIGRRGMLALGMVVLIAADAVLALMQGVPAVLAGVALWGLHLGLTQGLFSALVADAAPESLRGTAFGLFNLLTGLAMLVASLVAGIVWTVWGPGATFLTGAAAALVALAGLGLSGRTRALPA